MPEKIDQINKLIKALPLPKKGLYKLKDNINLDDYIAILQSKRENKTYTIDASELGGSSTGIQSLTAGDNITIDNTDPLNPIVSASGGGSSALFPNGNEEVLASRDFQLSDAGKILYINEPDVIISMPLVNPFQVGDNIGVLKSELNNSGFSLNGSDIIPLGGENVLITNILSGADVVPVLVSTTTINDGGVDKTALSYLYDKVTNAIPLSGTVEGSPVTGDIEFGGDIAIKTLNGDGNNFHSLTFSDGAIISKFNNNIYETALSVSDDIIISSGNANFKGIVGNNDWSSNYTDLSYTQKIYVDNAISSNRKVDTSYIFRNATLDSTCQITVINGISYRSCTKDTISTLTATSTTTFTNKRITVRVDSTTSSATPTINTDNVDTYKLTAQAVDITSFTTNLSGTPTDDQILHIVIIGTATRAITWGSKFEASTVVLPTTTVGTNRLDVYFIWNTATSKWRCGGVW